jgi:hypothetical protein
MIGLRNQIRADASVSRLPQERMLLTDQQGVKQSCRCAG